MRFICLILSVSSAFALSSITQPVTGSIAGQTGGAVKSSLGHAGVRLAWSTDAAAYTMWGWDTVSHAADGRTDCNSYIDHGSGGGHFVSNVNNHQVHGMYVAGLKSATTYFYCNGASTTSPISGGTQVRAVEDSFTTLAAPATHPALPLAPTPIDNTFPTCANGKIEVCSGGVPVPAVVGANCDDPSTGLVATYNAAAWGTVIQIPVTTICQSYYALAKGSWDGVGEMVVESQNIASLPPPGSRVSPSNSANMPNMVQSIYIVQDNLTFNSGSGSHSSCYPGGYYWDDTSNTPGWYMRYCAASGSLGTITNVTGTSVEFQPVYAVTLSATTGITPSAGQWGYMTGVGGIPKANGSFMVTSVSSATSFSVQMYNSYGPATSSVTYTSGGTLQFFDFTPISPAGGSVGFTSFTTAAPSGSCTPGTGVGTTTAWAYSNNPAGGSGTLAGNVSSGTYTNSGTTTGTGYSTARVWKCTATNTWSPYFLVPSGVPRIVASSGVQSTLDLANAIHTWIVGLQFTAQPTFNDPLLYHSGFDLSEGDNAVIQGGSTPGFHIFGISGTTQNVHIDRCLFTRQRPSKGTQFVQLNGTSLVLSNSYFKNTANYWWGQEDRGSNYDSAAGPMVVCGSLNGGLIYNNYIESYGIGVHCDDENYGGGFAHSANNVTVQRNTFFRDLTLINQAPGSSVDYYTPLRQLLEFKRGVQVDINGNTFTNNFQNVSQGGAIALGPESYTVGATAGLYCALSYASTTGTFTVNFGATYTVNIGDWIWLDNDDPTHMYVVTAVSPGSAQFTVPNLALGLPSNLFVMIITGGDGISDVNIRNNTFTGLPTLFGDYFHFNHDAGQQSIAPFDRISISNNIAYQTGPGGIGTGILSAPYAERWNCSGGTGLFYNIWHGGVDHSLTNNTWYAINPNLTPTACQGNAGAQGTILQFTNNDFPVINVAENEGLAYQNNVEWAAAVVDAASASSVSGFTCTGNGNTVLNCFYPSTSTLPYIVTNNCAYLPAGNPGGYSSPNFWGDFNTAPAQFVSPGTGNFMLLGTSGCKGQGTSGSDPGVNMPALLAAQGAIGSPGSIQSGSAVQAGSAVK